MKATCTCPDDLWGFTIEELQNVLKVVKTVSQAKLTNRTYSYDAVKKFQIVGLGKWKLEASSQKKLNLAIDEIKKRIRERRPRCP